MDNNTSYNTQAIDINLLSVLDITKDGKVVSAEKWVELWNLVFQHINKIDAFCVDMQSTLDNWHESEIALNEIVEDMQMKYAALSTGFIHYGENTPENPHIMLWVRHMNDISTHCFLTNEDVDSELSDTSTNPVQNKVANAALNNKMDKNNPTGTGSFSLNRKSDTVVGDYSFAEGSNGQATGTASHAEGNSTTASGGGSHAEGSSTKASGDYSHTEGERTTASGEASHTEGYLTKASGDYSHAEGNYTKALSACQHVQGRYNIEDSDNAYVDIVGNGSSNTERSNAYTLDWNGNAWYAGDVYVGSTSGTNKDAGSKKLATEGFVDTQITEKTDQTYTPESENAQSGIAVAEAIAAQPKQIPEITSLMLSDETPLGVYILKKDSNIMYVPQYYDDGLTMIPFTNTKVESDTLINVSRIPTLVPPGMYRYGIRVMFLSEVTEFDSVVPIKRTLGYIEYWKESSSSTGYPATGTITYYNYATTDYVTKAISDVSKSKVDKEDGKGLSTNDFTNEYKTKLDGIELGANKTITDSELSDTSTNPVQNKIITAALGDINTSLDRIIEIQNSLIGGNA